MSKMTLLWVHTTPNEAGSSQCPVGPNLLSSGLKTNAASISMSSPTFLFGRSSNLIPCKCSTVVKILKNWEEEPCWNIFYGYNITYLQIPVVIHSTHDYKKLEINSPSTSSTLVPDESVFMGNLHPGPLAPTFLAKSSTQNERSDPKSNRE